MVEQNKRVNVLDLSTPYNRCTLSLIKCKNVHFRCTPSTLCAEHVLEITLLISIWRQNSKLRNRQNLFCQHMKYDRVDSVIVAHIACVNMKSIVFFNIYKEIMFCQQKLKDTIIVY